MTTVLKASLVEDFRHTHYRVHGEPGFVLHVDEASIELEAVYRQAQVRCAAYLTAWDPESTPQPAAVNDEAMARLRADLIVGQHPTLAGRGVCPGEGDHGEDSVLVLGLGRELACEFGRRYRQNAILWADADAVPRLILLR